VTRILFDAFDTGAAPVVPPSGPDGILLVDGIEIELEIGATHVIEYWTDIHKSVNGLERRVKLLSKPRETIKTDVIITDEDVFRTLRRRRSFDPDEVYLIPVRFEGQVASTDIGGTSFSLDVTYVDWAVPGQRVFIEGPANGYHAVIQTAGSGPGVVTITVDTAPPAGNFPAIATTVNPVRPFYLESPSSVGRYQVGAGAWSAVARGYEPVATIGTGATVTTLDGLSILDKAPAVDGLGAEDRPEGDVVLHDYNARVLPEWQRTTSDIFRAHKFVVTSQAVRQYFRKFLETVAGRQKAFLLPTWRADFAPVPGSETGSQVDFEDGGDYADAWFADTSHRRFWITDATGTITFRTAQTATKVSGRSRVTFNAAVPANSTSYMFLELVRLANDATEFVYEAGCLGTVELRFLAVRQ
jgi:hypothetical protein